MKKGHNSIKEGQIKNNQPLYTTQTMGDNPRRFPDHPLKTGEGIVFIQKYLLTTLTQRTFVLKDKRCILNDNYCLKSTQIRRQSLDLLQVTLIVSSILYY